MVRKLVIETYLKTLSLHCELFYDASSCVLKEVGNICTAPNTEQYAALKGVD